MDRFDNRTVIVTGGGGGIGSAVCAACISNKVRVWRIMLGCHPDFKH